MKKYRHVINIGIQNSLTYRFLNNGMSAIPATNPPTCAQKATPPPLLAPTVAQPLKSCSANQTISSNQAISGTGGGVLQPVGPVLGVPALQPALF